MPPQKRKADPTAKQPSVNAGSTPEPIAAMPDSVNAKHLFVLDRDLEKIWNCAVFKGVVPHAITEGPGAHT